MPATARSGAARPTGTPLRAALLRAARIRTASSRTALNRTALNRTALNRTALNPATSSPATSSPATSSRVPRLRVALLGATLVAALSGTAACSGLDQASAAGATPQDLVAVVATQLAGVSTLTYTATYRLAGGDTARVTRSAAPDRVAYLYPGGRLIRTPDAVTRCVQDDRETVCTATDPGPDPAAVALPTGTGLVVPDDVRTMLDTASIDPDVEVVQRDTTLAGRPATCLRISGAEQATPPQFDTCVTVEGALASFTGAIDGKAVETVLTDYIAKADGVDFIIPTTAKFVDRRKN